MLMDACDAKCKIYSSDQTEVDRPCVVFCLKVPEVKIPFIVPFEILIKSHYVVTIQCILTTGCFIVQ